MRELAIPVWPINAFGLDQACRAALPGKFNGLSTYGPGRNVSFWLDDSAGPADDAVVQGLAAAHDPVYITVNKTQIAADGVDAATVTVQAPKQGAAPVFLQVNGQDVPITLVGGGGSDTITSLDPMTITITLKNPANRCSDSVTVKAV